MDENLQLGMHEATQLTRSGRLGEASALIQRLLGGTAPSGPTATPPGETGAARAPLLDLRPDAVEVEPVTDRARDERSPRGERGTRRLSDILARLNRGEFGAGHDRMPDLGHLPGLGDLPGPGGLPGAGRTIEPPLPDGARFEHGRFACAAGSRNYRLYVPGRVAERPALVVMLHGCTQDPADFAAGTGMNRQAEREGCLVLYPEQPAGANPNRCWNWFEAAHQRAGAGEPMILADMVREIVETRGIDPERVFVAGLSAGGAMAAVMAATHPELFKALGVHSGLAYEAANDIPSAFAAMRGAGPAARPVPAPMPTIVFHGDQDRTVQPVNGDRVVEQWRAAAGASAEPHRVVEEDGRAPGGRRYRRTRTLGPGGRIIVEQWRVQGAGHAWSGGDPAGSYTDPTGPDASAEMLRFFLEAAG